MAKPFNIALALSFTCLFLMLCVALAQRPSSDVTAALREDRDEPVDTGSKRNVSSQPAASWHAHRHVQYIFNTTSKLDDVAFGESKYFINKLFRKYGTPNMLPFPGLEKLMKNLGMITNNEITETMEGQLGQNINSKENPTASKKRRSSIHTHSDHSECDPARSLLSAFHFEHMGGLGTDHFLLFCPAIIEQLDNTDCHRQHKSIDDHGTRGHDVGADGAVTIADMAPEKTGAIGDIPPLVWLYSCVAVLVISLVGLLGVSVIPIMRRVLYKNLLQFLIALAVGALSGDALLHLLPHALSSGESDELDSPDSADRNNNRNNTGSTEEGHGHGKMAVWKGLVALTGLLFFFLTERILTIVTARRAKRRLKIKAGTKAVFHLRADDGDQAADMRLPRSPDCDDNIPIRETAIITDDDDDIESFLNKNGHPSHDHTQGHDQGEVQSQGHGHGHSHHHGDVPDSVSAVAWMVIFGDGIHNLSDGLAIGAAFAASVTGGFSTAVAVFCHELPHEIGDFAMLLSAGMTAKQAVLYNVLSSVLCFLGMVMGVLLGQVHSASAWIFSAVAGMFLYISLADMLPQLTVTERSGAASPCRQLLLQSLGITIGASIMLIIAIFENDLKTLMD